VPRVADVAGREVIDSRGRPTVEARCELQGGAWATASVPSGMSTGAAEARELRDGDPQRYRGLGCRRAAGSITGEIRAALAGGNFASQHDLDQALIDADGTPTKERLGANAVLAVSIAFAKAAAADLGVPLYRHLAEMADRAPAAVPRPMVNLFSGGKHAGGQVPVQDVLLVPAAASTIDECLSTVFEIYQTAAERAARYRGMRALRADEGGLAPPFPDAEAMLEEAVTCVADAGFKATLDDVALAVDVAASHFAEGDVYQLTGESLDGHQMVDRIGTWVDRFPIVSVEDGLGEDDWPHWPALKSRLRGRALVVGDDLLCTSPERIRRAIAADAADALLLKVNQIGTLTEAWDAAQLARAAGWTIIVSARSGETEDNWLADLAVGWGGDQIKIGSITQSERLAKYNRLLQIQAETGLPLTGAR
jgi:enolase